MRAAGARCRDAKAAGATDLATTATGPGNALSRTAGLLDPAGGLLARPRARCRGPVAAFDGEVWLVAWIEQAGVRSPQVALRKTGLSKKATLATCRRRRARRLCGGGRGSSGRRGGCSARGTSRTPSSSRGADIALPRPSSRRPGGPLQEGRPGRFAIEPDPRALVATVGHHDDRVDPAGLLLRAREHDVVGLRDRVVQRRATVGEHAVDLREQPCARLCERVRRRRRLHLVIEEHDRQRGKDVAQDVLHGERDRDAADAEA